MSRILIIAGVVLILAGVLHKFGLLSWFGNLPGDIKIEKENTRVYFPITTMIVLSVGFSLLLALFRRLS